MFEPNPRESGSDNGENDMARYRQWRAYVPVSSRRAHAKRRMRELRKQGVEVQPIEIEGRKIARTFWGAAWCDHLESFSDYENRLPRGRTYVRNGSVCHLAISRGKVDALVSGSEIYSVNVRIRLLGKKAWAGLRKRCAGRIGSLLELLQGRLSDQVMAVVTERETGLFPRPRGIEFDCDCPDWADMCKHVAAVLYGVGARLDAQPELLFLLRGVDHMELIAADAAGAVAAATTRSGSKRLAPGDLGDVFGIELDEGVPLAKVRTRTQRKASRPKKAVKKRAVKKKGAKKKPAKNKATKKKAAAVRKKVVVTRTTGGRKPAARKKAAKKKVARKKSAKKKAAKKKAAARRKAAKKKAAKKKTAARKKAAKK